MENDMWEPKIWSQKYVKSTRVVVLSAWNSIFDQAKFWKPLGYVSECEAAFGAHNRAPAKKKQKKPCPRPDQTIFSFEVRNQSKPGL